MSPHEPPREQALEPLQPLLEMLVHLQADAYQGSVERLLRDRPQPRFAFVQVRGAGCELGVRWGCGELRGAQAAALGPGGRSGCGRAQRRSMVPGSRAATGRRAAPVALTCTP
jgi:hypothetical protein